MEVAEHVGSVVDRLDHRSQVVDEEPGTELVILVGDPVLGDHHRQSEFLAQRDQGTPQAPGVDAPAKAVPGQRRVRIGAHEEARGGAPVEAHPLVRVVVETQVVQGAAEPGHHLAAAGGREHPAASAAPEEPAIEEEIRRPRDETGGGGAGNWPEGPFVVGDRDHRRPAVAGTALV